MSHAITLPVKHDGDGIWLVRQVAEEKFEVYQKSSGVVVASPGSRELANRVAAAINACAIVPRMLSAGEILGEIEHRRENAGGSRSYNEALGHIEEVILTRLGRHPSEKQPSESDKPKATSVEIKRDLNNILRVYLRKVDKSVFPWKYTVVREALADVRKEIHERNCDSEAEAEMYYNHLKFKGSGDQEVYHFSAGFTAKREYGQVKLPHNVSTIDAGGYWILRNENHEVVDRDKYIDDLCERMPF